MFRPTRERPASLWLAVFGLALAGRTACAATDHPFHASRASVAFNAETSSLEVSLCVFPDDLAAAVARQGGPALNYQDAAQVDEWAARYVAARFQLWAGERSLSLHWVGHEQETQQLWLYFEFPLEANELPELAVRNAVLLEQFDDQVNDVSLDLNGRCRTLTFDGKHADRRPVNQ